MKWWLLLFLLTGINSAMGQTGPLTVVNHPQGVTSYASSADWPIINAQWHVNKDGVTTHDHCEVRAPAYAKVSQPFPVYVTGVLFHFPGRATAMTIDQGPVGGSWSSLTSESLTGDPNGVVSFHATVMVDPAKFARSGVQEMPVHCTAVFGDNSMQVGATARVPLWIDTAAPASGITPWFAGQTNGINFHPGTSNPFPFEYSIIKFITPVPVGPITAPYTLKLELGRAQQALNCCGMGNWYTTLAWDANLHFGDPGNIFVSDSFTATTATKTYTVVIDPAQFTPGDHSLFVRAETPNTNDDNQTQAAVTRIAFTIPGGLPTPTSVPATATPTNVPPTPTRTPTATVTPTVIPPTPTPTEVPCPPGCSCVCP